jgi:hypothetical protein
MAIQLSDEMIIMTPETVVQDELVILFPKERSILFKDEHIILIQIKEVCDRIKSSFSHSEEGRLTLKTGLIEN